MISQKINKIIGATLTVAFLFGCSEAKKLEKAKRVFDSHSLEASEYCYLKFPVENTIEYRPGRIIIDTIFDTIDNIKYDTLYLQTDEIEPVKVITQVKYKTIFKRQIDTVFKAIENTAKIKAYEHRFLTSQEVEKKQEEIINQQGNAIRSKNKLNLWLLIIIGLQSIYILRKPLLKLFI